MSASPSRYRGNGFALSNRILSQFRSVRMLYVPEPLVSRDQAVPDMALPAIRQAGRSFCHELEETQQCSGNVNVTLIAGLMESNQNLVGQPLRIVLRHLHIAICCSQGGERYSEPDVTCSTLVGPSPCDAETNHPLLLNPSPLPS
jgi:hypothetical protein